MLKVETVQSLYFSPGGTTEKITKAIVKNVGLKKVTPIDLTRPNNRKRFKGEVKGDLLIVGMPVYHESPPWPTLASLNQLKGEGKWAVPVAVYGNRTEGTCVEEMGKILKSRGFKILAADFGKRIGSKLSLAPSEIHLSSRLVSYFTHEEVDSFPEGYHRSCVDSLAGLGGLGYDEKAGCTNCMKCIESCPTSALELNPYKLDEKECIRCMACTKACPTGAMGLRLVDSEQNRQLFKMLDRVFAVRREPITRL